MVARIIMLGALLLAACGSPAPTADATETPALSEQEALGQRLFSQNCAACHTLAGNAVIVGPAMAGIASRAGARVEGLSAQEYLVESIMDPSVYLVPGFDDLMPKTWGRTLTGEELDALVAFMLTLH